MGTDKNAQTLDLSSMSSLEELFIGVSGGNPILLGLLGGFFISTLNAFGGIPVLFFKHLPQRLNDVALGFAAGVMLAASFTSLIIPGIELGGVLPVALGVLLGAGVVSVADRIVPHMHRIIGEEGIKTSRLRSVWLFVLAIILHNMPEGLAVGVGMGSGNINQAIILMIAIGLQNMPEGLSVAFSFMGEGEEPDRLRSFIISTISGLVEMPLCVLGAWAVTLAASILPYGMGFAAGAMIFVISDEIIPETHRLGHERLASYGLIIGLLIMLTMDVLLG